MADEFVRGRKAHASREVQWRCDVCGNTVFEGPTVVKMFCASQKHPKKRWMYWEPVNTIELGTS